MGGAGGGGSEGVTLKERLSSPTLAPAERLTLIVGAVCATAGLLVDVL